MNKISRTLLLFLLLINCLNPHWKKNDGVSDSTKYTKRLIKKIHWNTDKECVYLDIKYDAWSVLLHENLTISSSYE